MRNIDIHRAWAKMIHQYLTSITIVDSIDMYWWHLTSFNDQQHPNTTNLLGAVGCTILGTPMKIMTIPCGCSMLLAWPSQASRKRKPICGARRSLLTWEGPTDIQQIMLSICFNINRSRTHISSNPPTPLWRWRRAYWGATATLNAQWHLLI